MMRHQVALSLIGAAFLAGCSSNPEESDHAPLVGSQRSLHSVDRTPLNERVTVVMRLRNGSPQNARASLRNEGADFVSPASDGAPFIFASMSPERARHIATIPWVEVVAIDSISHPRLTSQVVPWGVDSIGARYVHTNLSVKGTGIKIAMLDDGIQCDHSDLDDRIAGGYDFLDGDSNYCAPVGQHGRRAPA